MTRLVIAAVTGLAIGFPSIVRAAAVEAPRATSVDATAALFRADDPNAPLFANRGQIFASTCEPRSQRALDDISALIDDPPAARCESESTTILPEPATGAFLATAGLLTFSRRRRPATAR